MRQHIIDGKTFKRICGDDTRYGYVSDEVYKTWEKCPVCFAEGSIALPARRVKVNFGSDIHNAVFGRTSSLEYPRRKGRIPESEAQKKGLYLRDALE